METNMCGACGVLRSGPEWLEEGLERSAGSRLAERQKRIRIVNHLLRPTGTKLTESAGRLVLSSFTGRTRVIDDLAHVWLGAAEIGRRPVDPLDETFIGNAGVAQ
jgi:hypothetical protein